MAAKFKNKYKVETARLQDWDYGNNAAYFITICCKNHEYFFGEVTNEQMKLNETGETATEICKEIPKQFRYAELVNFIIMPNHMHALVIINRDNPEASDIYGQHKTRLIAYLHHGHVRGENLNTKELHQEAIPKKPGGVTGNKNPMLHDNISRIIRWYKGRCSFEIRKTVPIFSWQPRFHEHILLDKEAFINRKFYIFNNPKNWNIDRLNKTNIE